MPHPFTNTEPYERHEPTLRRRPSAPPVRQVPKLAGLAVLDTPARSTTQGEALERLRLAGDEFAQGIFARSGVQRRELILDETFLASSLRGRTARVEQELFGQAVRAVDELGIEPGRVGAVLTSSLYSLGCPSLAHRLIEHYRLDPDVDKYHLTAVGCASAVPLFRLGAQIVHANPSREVLIVAAESMSSILVPSRDGDPRVKTVGSAIFGDGCAAALLGARRDSEGPAVLATTVHQVSGTLDAVELAFDEHDSHLGLARELPEIATEQLSGLVERFLATNHVQRREIAHWMLHPGGRRIVEQARDALNLDDDDVAVSWQVLAEHGNVGTPSIFYVLDATIRERRPQAGELGLAVTIGPGVTVGLMLLGF
ncbi:MAG TPA: 3-oxoacyl-[acyl-carrier-protein] synthase III C-terminal domain-containing protein [Solirubrobacteraceae bacterium]|nr:3-oxoacyl-[acyl-carrier-protein] synthase III C-terminal domain-containing protein [Solirubrobacteraceae bacterium]